MRVDLVFLAWNRLEFTRFTFEKLLRNTNWDLVRQLRIYDDGSTDGTREYLDEALAWCPIDDKHLVHLGWGSPVATMNYHAANTTSRWMAKVDNDAAVPPGWLDVMTGVLERHPELELLGMEPGFTYVPGRDGIPWDGVYSYQPAGHIGGLGLIRADMLREKPARAKGRYGWTEWAYQHEPVAGWVAPDLPVVLMDRLPFEPWLSLAAEYVDRRWARPWDPWDPQGTSWAWEWCPEVAGPVAA